MAVGAAVGELFVKLGLKTTLKSDLEKEKTAAATASAGIQAAIGSATGKTITVKSKVAEILQNDYNKAKTVLAGFENFYKTHQTKINAIAAGITTVATGAVALDQKYRVLSNTAEQNAYLMGVSAEENNRYIQAAAGAKGDIEGALAIQTQFIRNGITDGNIILKNTQAIRNLAKVTNTDMVTVYGAMQNMLESTGEPLDNMTDKVPLFFAAWKNDIDMSEVATMISRNSVAIRNSGLSVEQIIGKLVALREEGYRGRSLYTNFNKVLEEFNTRDETAVAAVGRMTELQKDYNDTIAESKQLTADYNKDLEDLQSDAASKIEAIRSDSHKSFIQKNNEIAKVEQETADKVEEMTRKYKTAYQDKIDTGKKYQDEYQKQAKIAQTGTADIDDFIKKTFSAYKSDDATKVTDDLKKYKDEYGKLVELRSTDATGAEKITGEINKQAFGIEQTNKGLADTLGIVAAIASIPLISSLVSGAIGAGIFAKVFGVGAGAGAGAGVTAGLEGMVTALTTGIAGPVGAGILAGLAAAWAMAKLGVTAGLKDIGETVRNFPIGKIIMDALTIAFAPIGAIGTVVNDLVTGRFAEIPADVARVFEMQRKAIDDSIGLTNDGIKEQQNDIAKEAARTAEIMARESEKKEGITYQAGKGIGQAYTDGIKAQVEKNLPKMAETIDEKVSSMFPMSEAEYLKGRREGTIPAPRKSYSPDEEGYARARQEDIARADRLAKQESISRAQQAVEPIIVTIQNLNVKEVADTGEAVKNITTSFRKNLKAKGYYIGAIWAS